MGWHAATLTMASLMLALRSDGMRRAGWIGLAGWGGVGLMLCARRKMISMLPPFVLVLVGLYLAFRHASRVWPLLITVAVALVAGAYAYTRVGSDEDLENFYATALHEAGERVRDHGFGSVVVTVRQAGFFGYGLGMAVQGVHHIRAARPRVWQESGPSMLMAEVGVPGFAMLLAVLFFLLRTVMRALRRAAETTEASLFFCLAALVAANLLAAIVSAQIYGDPFIGMHLAFIVGLVLSAERLRPGPDTRDEQSGGGQAGR